MEQSTKSKIEKFIYTSVNNRGRSIQYKTIDLAFLSKNFHEIIELFEQITPSLNLVFSKFNKDYYIYYECKEIGYEKVGKEKKKGRKGNVFIGLLIPIKLIEELHYDFALVYLLLSKEINWENIVEKIEKEKLILESSILDFNINELEEELLQYLRNNHSSNNFNLSKKKLKIISDSNIINLIHYASSLPKDIGKDTIFSTLKLHSPKDNSDISINTKIPEELFFQQDDFLNKINKKNYQNIKNYHITAKSVSKFIPIEPIVPSIKPKISFYTKEKKKILISFSVVTSLFLIFSPFYQYYQLTNISIDNMTSKDLNQYKKLILKQGLLLNYFTDSLKKYKKIKKNFLITNENKILNIRNCSVDIPMLNLTKYIIIEYPKSNKIKKLTEKYTCMLDKKIRTTGNLEKQTYIAEYRKVAINNPYKYDDNLIKFYIEEEVKYFSPIIEALRLGSKDDILKLIKEYEEYSKLRFYQKKIQRIEKLLNKQEIEIIIHIFSKEKTNVNIEYLGIGNKIKTLENIIRNQKKSISIAYEEKAFLNVEKEKVFEGRLLKSTRLDIKKFKTIELSLSNFPSLNYERFSVNLEMKKSDEIIFHKPTYIKLKKYLEDEKIDILTGL